MGESGGVAVGHLRGTCGDGVRVLVFRRLRGFFEVCCSGVFFSGLRCGLGLEGGMMGCGWWEGKSFQQWGMLAGRALLGAKGVLDGFWKG